MKNIGILVFGILLLSGCVESSYDCHIRGVVSSPLEIIQRAWFNPIIYKETKKSNTPIGNCIYYDRKLQSVPGMAWITECSEKNKDEPSKWNYSLNVAYTDRSDAKRFKSPELQKEIDGIANEIQTAINSKIGPDRVEMVCYVFKDPLM